MRIISGYHRGRKIQAPKNLPVRPTTDMAKEALFNILNNRYYFDDISVLDLFSGTGNVSYEFASRGTTKILSVDSHNACVKFIEQTAHSLDLPISSIKADVFKFLEHHNDCYTVIFADPPYDFSIENFAKIPRLIFENGLLEENGILVVEHSKHTDLSNVEYFSISKGYGGCKFSFFEKK